MTTRPVADGRRTAISARVGVNQLLQRTVLGPERDVLVEIMSDSGQLRAEDRQAIIALLVGVVNFLSQLLTGLDLGIESLGFNLVVERSLQLLVVFIELCPPILVDEIDLRAQSRHCTLSIVVGLVQLGNIVLDDVHLRLDAVGTIREPAVRDDAEGEENDEPQWDDQRGNELGERTLLSRRPNNYGLLLLLLRVVSNEPNDFRRNLDCALRSSRALILQEVDDLVELKSSLLKQNKLFCCEVDILALEKIPNLDRDLLQHDYSYETNVFPCLSQNDLQGIMLSFESPIVATPNKNTI